MRFGCNRPAHGPRAVFETIAALPLLALLLTLALPRDGRKAPGEVSELERRRERLKLRTSEAAERVAGSTRLSRRIRS